MSERVYQILPILFFKGAAQGNIVVLDCHLIKMVTQGLPLTLEDINLLDGKSEEKPLVVAFLQMCGVRVT